MKRWRIGIYVHMCLSVCLQDLSLSLSRCSIVLQLGGACLYLSRVVKSANAMCQIVLPSWLQVSLSLMAPINKTGQGESIGEGGGHFNPGWDGECTRSRLGPSPSGRSFFFLPEDSFKDLCLLNPLTTSAGRFWQKVCTADEECEPESGEKTSLRNSKLTNEKVSRQIWVLAVKCKLYPIFPWNCFSLKTCPLPILSAYLPDSGLKIAF